MFKKLISSIICFALLVTFVPQQAFAYDNVEDEVVYSSEETVDRVDYTYETKTNVDTSIITTDVREDGKLTNVVVVSYNEGIITDNGEVVGTIEEIREKPESNNVRHSAIIDEIITRGSGSESGGGVTKTLMSTYKTGLSSTARNVVTSVVQSLAVSAATATCAYFGWVNKGTAALIMGMGAFINDTVRSGLPGTRYVKAYYTTTQILLV